MVFVVSTSCKKLEDLNANKKDFTVVPGEALFNGATKALFDQMGSPNVNQNNTQLFVQYFAETTYPDESDYDMVTRPIPAFHMNTLYRNVLMNYKDAKRALLATPLLYTDQKQRNNQLAEIEIMSVFTWSNIVETFGDMPYLKALDLTNPTPPYDDGLTIYKDLIARLNAAISIMDPTFGGMGAGYDNIFGGEVASTAKWIKFANTLKLRMGLMLSDIPTEAAFTKTVIESAAPNVFNVPITSSTDGDKCAMTFLPSSPNQNPFFDELVNTGRSDFVVTSTLVDPMNALSDPRRVGFMWTMVDGVYKGGIAGDANSYNSYSHINNDLLTPTREFVLMDYVESEFLLAEAVARGYGVPGSIETHYNNAIRSSILYWGGTESDVITYLSRPDVAYSSATGTWRQKIGTQAWYAYYLRGFTAWTSWRRLDWPHLMATPNHVQEVNGIPMRYIYPVSEQTLNSANYKAAASKIGGDNAMTRLFWDKGPENYDTSQ